jgi:hypothetical protein
MAQSWSNLADQAANRSDMVYEPPTPPQVERGGGYLIFLICFKVSPQPTDHEWIIIMRRMGWAVFALVAIALAGYVLNRGIYIGYTLTSYRAGERAYFLKKCRYLNLNGTDEVPVGGSTHNPSAETDSCPPLKNPR